MAKTRASVKKATKSTGGHASSTTTVHESKSPRPVQTKEPVIFLNKAAKERFHDNILKQNFHLQQGISISPQQDLGKQVFKTISKLKWETFCTHPGSYSPSLIREFYANLYDHELEFTFVREGLIPWDAKNINELYNPKVDVNEHSEFIDGIIDEK
ncbi:hypothetical protein V6Z11_A12G098800 [Gossypium hirsutum]